ncbi:MAG: SPOR domain-containing protein [Tannerella sp.]|jgi:cell division protein FtsN|nr:SPOR domain-containing protein [Tannerella sp.]
MKKIMLIMAVTCGIIFLGSCKSKSSAYKTAYEQAKANDKAVMYEDEDEEMPTGEEISYESVRQESVKPVSGENATGLKKYSVVIGSFKNKTNAYSLKERMTDEGYSPVIAENEYGMLRVIITSFDNKADAVRSRDNIKTKYEPNFQDAWILERMY